MPASVRHPGWLDTPWGGPPDPEGSREPPCARSRSPRWASPWDWSSRRPERRSAPSGPVLWLLGAVPALLAVLGYAAGVKALALADETRGDLGRAVRVPARRDRARRRRAGPAFDRARHRRRRARRQHRGDLRARPRRQRDAGAPLRHGDRLGAHRGDGGRPGARVGARLGAGALHRRAVARGAHPAGRGGPCALRAGRRPRRAHPRRPRGGGRAGPRRRALPVALRRGPVPGATGACSPPRRCPRWWRAWTATSRRPPRRPCARATILDDLQGAISRAREAAESRDRPGRGGRHGPRGRGRHHPRAGPRARAPRRAPAVPSPRSRSSRRPASRPSGTP